MLRAAGARRAGPDADCHSTVALHRAAATELCGPAEIPHRGGGEVMRIAGVP
jgi:hypothetical protein